MSYRIGAVLSEWARRLHAYASDHASGVEIVLVRDQRAALESELDVLVVDATTLWVDEALVERTAAADMTVVGVFTEPGEEPWLSDLGITHRMAAEVSPDNMLFLLDRLRPGEESASAGQHPGWGPPSASLAGDLVVVGGPPGAGAREIALGLAVRMPSSVLVDANEAAPGVARRIGYELQPHILSAIDAATSGGDVTSMVSAPSSAGDGSAPCDVIAGLPAPGEWHRFTTAGLDALIEACRARWSYSVVLTSPIVEDLRRWVDRYGTSRRLLATAPTLVGVCEASPRGALRYAEWLTEAGPPAAVLTVINKLPWRSPSIATQVADHVRSLCGDRIQVVALVPFDRRVTRAEWDGAVPTRGPFSRRLDELAALVVDELDQHGGSREVGV